MRFDGSELFFQSLFQLKFTVNILLMVSNCGGQIRVLIKSNAVTKVFRSGAEFKLL
jgi:hypothetical protein